MNAPTRGLDFGLCYGDFVIGYFANLAWLRAEDGGMCERTALALLYSWCHGYRQALARSVGADPEIIEGDDAIAAEQMRRLQDRMARTVSAK